MLRPLMLLAALGLLWGPGAASASEVSPATSEGGRTLTVRWTPDAQARAAWLAPPPPGLPDAPPEASLKLALPQDAEVVMVVASSSWAPAGPGAGPAGGEVARLGARGRWRGIAYQEILVHPVRPATDGREVLTELVLRVSVTTPGVRFSDPGPAPAGTPESPLFLNPADARPSPSRTRVSAESPSAPAPGLRLLVAQDGVYRADYAWLTARGFDPTGKDPRNFSLTCQGVTVPILVEGESDGLFGPGDAVVFYGQRASLPARPLWNGGDFTDTNVYWLRTESAPGLRMAQVPAAPLSGFPAVTTFQSVVRAETDSFFTAVDHLRPNGSLWYWGPAFGTYAGGPSSARSLTLQAPNAAPGNCEIRLVQAALGAGTHALQARLNGAAPLSGADPWTWSGKAVTEATWTFPAPAAGANTLALTVPGYPDHADYQVPDHATLTYWRTLAADGGALLLTAPDAAATYTSSGYGASPYILDLSRTDLATGLCLPRCLTGAAFASGTAAFEMAADGGVPSRRVALSASPLAPSSAQVAAPEDLAGASAGADLLVITVPGFAPGDPGSAWQRWLTRRSQSLSVRVVSAQDIFDNFSGGLFDPPALRQFLVVAGTSWDIPPRYLLLVGDATWDYENRNGTPGFLNTVPTLMVEDLGDGTYLGRFAADAWFADWDGDGYPDAAVGRLPVSSAAEAEGAFEKLLTYEDQALSGSWYTSAAFVADKQDGQGQEFETYLDALAATWTAAPWSSTKVYYGQPPFNGTDPVACSVAIRAAFPASALLTYSGHGSFTWWGYNGGASALFTAQKVRSGNTLSDVDLLSATPHLPFVLQGTCYSSSFAEPGWSGQASQPALGEDLTVRADRGAIGACGQTTIGYASEEQTFNSAFFGQAFGVAKVRTGGDLVEAGRFSLPSTNARAVLGNALLGDPALDLRLPAPAPPGSLSATAQNTAAYLDWPPAASAEGYHVYRSSNGGSSWTRLTASPLPGTQTDYTAAALTNTVTYHFYVTSVDAGGFQGAPSPVASATPLNPDPPAVPGGLTATDGGTGDSVDLRWQANAEPDLSGYTLWWGTASGSYTASQGLSKTLTATRLSGLTTGVPYFFTLTASNTSGQTSAPAAEAQATPTALRLAVRPPAMVTDLRVARSGADLALSWTKPAVDLGGSPVSVTHFHLFRVVGAFDWNLDTVSLSAPNARVTIPATAEVAYAYTDTGAASLPGVVTYLVVAFGPDGDRSPASTPPPGPVLGLRVARSSTTGHTLLSFPPVTTTADGSRAALVDHYSVYGFFPVSASSDHVRPTAPALQATLLAGLPSCEGAAVFCDATTAPPLFYTVVAVDRRGNAGLY